MPRRKEKVLVHLDLAQLSQETSDKRQSRLGIQDDLFLGGVLKQTRETKGISLETVSKKLKIKEVYLSALENGQYYAFPGLTYGVGFLRAYAQFLGLDAKALVDRFYEETSDIKKQPLDMPVVSNKNILPSGKTVAHAALLVCVAYLVWYLISVGLSPRPVVTTDITDEASVVDNGASVASNESLDPMVSVDTLVAENVIQQPVTHLQPKLQKATDASAQPVKKAVKTPVIGFKTYGLKQPAHLSFIAVQKTAFEVKDADKTVFSVMMQPGDQYNVPAESDHLRLLIANPKAVTVFVDGRPYGTVDESKKDALGGYVLRPQDFKYNRF